MTVLVDVGLEVGTVCVKGTTTKQVSDEQHLEKQNRIYGRAAIVIAIQGVRWLFPFLMCVI